MARLTNKERAKLPASDFALPGRRYPIEDKAHARDALARVAMFGTSTMQREVKAAIKRKFLSIQDQNK